MRAIVTAAVVLTLALTAFDSTAAQPPTVAIPDVVTLPPRESVTFRAADDATLTVTNQSSSMATVAYDGAVLTIAMRSNIGNYAPIVTAPPAAPPLPSCTSVMTRGTDGILQCDVQPSAEGRDLPFSSIHGDIIISGPFERVELAAGCNDVTLTYLPRTPVLGLAQTVRPFHALDAIWYYDAATGRFIWWSSHAPDEENQYTEVSVLGESVTICVSEPATFGQPASAAPAEEPSEPAP